jgi:predicted acylesterase/phospholipase RssA
MDAPQCLFVLGALMGAVMTFFWAAGRTQKELDRALESVFGAYQDARMDLQADPSKPDQTNCN